MIRLATIQDREKIIEMLEHYREASPLDIHQTSNDSSARKLLNLLFEKNLGLVFLAEKKEQVVGMLIAIKNINIWDQERHCLNELAYWVEPEYRGTTIGYRLLKAYQKAGDYMISRQEISYYTVTKMSTSPDLKYGKMGFTKLEETWVCQQA